MNHNADDELVAALRALPQKRSPGGHRKQLEKTAPAPRTLELIKENGAEPTAQALAAWDKRLSGAPIIDIAHELGVSIQLAKHLLAEVHSAIYEDLKAALEQNRAIDLARVDMLLAAHLPLAKSGDEKSANVVLRALQHRARLTGQEPEPHPSRLHAPEAVLNWIQVQLPQINKIVDSLPAE